VLPPPDPAGNDRQNESVTLVNLGDQQVDLRGWTLRDLAGTTWSLDALGRIDLGEEKTIQRNGQTMALDNRGRGRRADSNARPSE
jgi:hypothetical protein